MAEHAPKDSILKRRINSYLKDIMFVILIVIITFLLTKSFYTAKYESKSAAANESSLNGAEKLPAEPVAENIVRSGEANATPNATAEQVSVAESGGADGADSEEGISIEFGNVTDESGRNQLIGRMLEKAERVVVYSYTYTPPVSKSGITRYYVKGNVARLELTNMIIDGSTKINVIFIDKDKKEAWGICDKRIDKVSCSKSYDSSNLYKMDYNDYDIKLPFEWLEENLYAADVEQHPSKSFGGKTSAVLIIHDDKIEKITEIYVDPDYGVPFEVRVVQDELDIVHRFNNLIINRYEDRQVYFP